VSINSRDFAFASCHCPWSAAHSPASAQNWHMVIIVIFDWNEEIAPTVLRSTTAILEKFATEGGGLEVGCASHRDISGLNRN